jgi:surfeit locus 1 family protein
MTEMLDRRKTARIKREEARMAAEKYATSRHWVSPHWMAWCFIIVATAVLFGLSAWQLERLQWKKGLLSEIHASRYSRAEAFPSDETTLKTMNFHRYRVSGEYLHDYEIHLAARYYKSQLGYHILVPFQLDDGRVLLVNRGWVKVDDKLPSTRTEGQVQGKQSIIVMVRNDNDRSTFTPDPDIQGNVWFWRDIHRIADVTKLDIVPTNFDVLYDAPKGGKPLPSDGLIELRNDHLGYALTWFFIGITGIVTFTMFHYRLPDAPPVKS